MIKTHFITVAVFISGIAIPISTAFQNIGALLLILAFLFWLYKNNQLTKVGRLPFPATGLLLGAALAIGTMWSSASSNASWTFFWKLHAYYFIPIFFIVLSFKKYRNVLLFGFMFGVLLSVMLSCFSAWFNYPVFKAMPGDWFIFRTHTYQNFFAAIVGVGIIVVLLTKKISKSLRLSLSFILTLISYSILFLVAGRTGQIIYALMVVFVLLLWNWKYGLIFGLTIIVALALLLPLYSPVYNLGINNAKADLNSFSQGDAYTSVGLRLTWYKNSLELIKEKPWFGHGTGSFKSEYERVSGAKDTSLATENPHNDYLWLSVDLGIFGGLLLLGLLITAAWQGRNLKPAWRLTLYALLLGMGVSTLANSFFTDNITSMAFVLLTCALLNGSNMKAASND